MCLCFRSIGLHDNPRREEDGRTDGGLDEADSRFSQLLCNIPNECDVSKTEFLYKILQTS